MLLLPLLGGPKGGRCLAPQNHSEAPVQMTFDDFGDPPRRSEKLQLGGVCQVD